MSETKEVPLLLEKDGVIVKEVGVYGARHEDAKVMGVDDVEMMRLLDVVLRRLRLLLLRLVVVVGLGLQHDVAAWLLASRLQQHLHYITDLIQSCPKRLENKEENE